MAKKKNYNNASLEELQNAYSVRMAELRSLRIGRSSVGIRLPEVSGYRHEISKYKRRVKSQKNIDLLSNTMRAFLLATEHTVSSMEDQVKQMNMIADHLGAGDFSSLGYRNANSRGLFIRDLLDAYSTLGSAYESSEYMLAREGKTEAETEYLTADLSDKGHSYWLTFAGKVRERAKQSKNAQRYQAFMETADESQMELFKKAKKAKDWRKMWYWVADWEHFQRTGEHLASDIYEERVEQIATAQDQKKIRLQLFRERATPEYLREYRYTVADMREEREAGHEREAKALDKERWRIISAFEQNVPYKDLLDFLYERGKYRK